MKDGSSFNERVEAAAKAKQAALERFKSRATPSAADLEQRAATAANAAAREERRAAAKEERKVQVKAEKAAAKVAAEAEALAAIERAEILKSEQKAARDLRYAARKARK